jgi:Predicted hydrolases or acyltransferases (alpha/beta hydrolase superfamily)
MVAMTVLLVAWVIAVQAGCFAMRTPDNLWRSKLSEKGQTASPDFLAPGAAGRIGVHVVAVQSSATLPLVVLVHGSPGSSDAFLDYLADTLLSRQFRLAALDRPGFGYTSGFGRPEPSLDAQAEALKGVVDALTSPPEKTVLVGHSLGAPVIARYAMLWPEKVAGLVLVAGSVDPSLEEHPWWQKAVDLPPLKWLTPRPLWVSNAEIIPLEGELTRIAPDWPKITCPVRVIHAVNDRLVPVANAHYAMEKLVNSADKRLELMPEGDHFILWSAQEAVKQAIRQVCGE